MNCAEFHEILDDMGRPGTAGLAQRESALAHAESCSACGRLLMEAEALDFSLHAMALQDANRAAPLRVEANLLREFRSRHAASERQEGRWYVAVIGVAAIALLAIGVMRVWPVFAPAKKNVPGVTSSTQTSNPAPASNVNSTSENDTLNSLASADEGTAFVRLPYADGGSLEGGAVIRVSMPRSALASWGLPVSGVAGAERIPAELLVSEDGMPQAIRLISQTAD